VSHEIAGTYGLAAMDALHVAAALQIQADERFLCVTQSQLSWGLTTFLDFVHSSLYVREYLIV